MINKMKELYFDNATTTRVDEEVLKAMIPYLSDNYGNPSAIYGVARKSKKALENATIEMIDEDIIKVVLKRPMARITRGQSAVFYINDIVIGGGKII